MLNTKYFSEALAQHIGNRKYAEICAELNSGMAVSGVVAANTNKVTPMLLFSLVHEKKLPSNLDLYLALCGWLNISPIAFIDNIVTHQYFADCPNCSAGVFSDGRCSNNSCVEAAIPSRKSYWLFYLRMHQSALSSKNSDKPRCLGCIEVEVNFQVDLSEFTTKLEATINENHYKVRHTAIVPKGVVNISNYFRDGVWGLKIMEKPAATTN
jgi:hypothetical protein